METQKDYTQQAVGRDPEREYAEMRAVSRTLPSGFQVKFRPLGVLEWAAIWRSVPTLRTGNDGRVVADLSETETDEYLRRAKETVLAASIDPKFHDETPFGPKSGMAVAMLSDEDLADMTKAVAVATFSLDSKKAKDAKAAINS